MDRNAPWGQRSLPWGPADQPSGQTTPALRRSSSTGLRTTSTRGTDIHPSQRLMLICRTIVRNCLSANLTGGLGSCHLVWMRWWMAGKPLLEILRVEHIAKDIVSVDIFGGGGGAEGWDNIPIFLLEILDDILSAKIMWQQMTKFIARSWCINCWNIRIKSLVLLVIQQELAIADCDKGKNKTGKISRERSKEKNSNYFAQIIETHIWLCDTDYSNKIFVQQFRFYIVSMMVLKTGPTFVQLR